MQQTPGEMLREARTRHGVSQKRLAIRAGTTQSAISRIERDQVSPSIETLRKFLHLVGEDLLLESRPRDFGIDATLNQQRRAMTVEDRVGAGLDFSDFVRRHRGVARKRKAT